MAKHVKLFLALALGIALGACASAGGTGAASAAPQQEEQDDPQQAWTGPTPDDNLWTRSATLYLSRARLTRNAEDARRLYQQALDAAKEGIQNDPSNPKVWFLAGRAQLQLQQYVTADSLFDKAMSLYPYYQEIDQERRNAWVRVYNRGVTALQSGNQQQAIEFFRDAAVIYDGDAGASLQLGQLYTRAGQSDRAITSYERALEILRALPTDGMTPEQLAQHEQSQEAAAFNLAQLLANGGRLAEATRAYEAFIERNPENASAQINLAVLLIQQDRTAEARDIFSALLDRPDLTAQDYFVTGIGLFNADLEDRAAEAFRRALELNPYSRDSRYNLVQALYSQTVGLSDELEAATADSATQRIEGELRTLYTEIEEHASRLLAATPYHANTLLLLAQAYRGRADLAPTETVSNELRAKAIETLTRQRDLPFRIAQVSLRRSTGAFAVSGQLTNLKLEPGTPVSIAFTLIGEGGAPVATETVTVTAPAAEQTASFQLSLALDGEFLGWKYEVVQ